MCLRLKDKKERRAVLPPPSYTAVLRTKARKRGIDVFGAET